MVWSHEHQCALGNVPQPQDQILLVEHQNRMRKLLHARSALMLRLNSMVQDMVAYSEELQEFIDAKSKTFDRLGPSDNAMIRDTLQSIQSVDQARSFLQRAQ
jgi:hypothetical protein